MDLLEHDLPKATKCRTMSIANWVQHNQCAVRLWFSSGQKWSHLQSWWVLLANRKPRANLHQHMKVAKTSCNRTLRIIHVNNKRDKDVASYFNAPTRTDEAPFAVCMNYTNILGVGIDHEATLSQIHMPVVDLQWSTKNTSSKAM